MLAHAYASGVGVDHDPEMVNTARRNRPDHLRERVEFRRMEGPFPTVDEYARQFESLGCHGAVRAHRNTRAWFADLESLVFYLKAAPFPEDFDPTTHLVPFNRYLARAATPRGYETNEDSDLLVVQKRGA